MACAASTAPSIHNEDDDQESKIYSCKLSQARIILVTMSGFS